MAYATYSDIEQDFKDQSFSASAGNIRQADVTQFIAEADALINSFVGTRYTVPVTTGEGLTLMKFLSRCLVTARIKKILEVKQEKSTDANQNIVGTLLSPTQVMKILKDIQDGNLTVIGAEALLSSAGFYSQNAVDCVEFVAKKDERQW